MAKKATTRGRKNARLQTNFKAETQAGSGVDTAAAGAGVATAGAEDDRGGAAASQGNDGAAGAPATAGEEAGAMTPDGRRRFLAASAGLQAFSGAIMALGTSGYDLSSAAIDEASAFVLADRNSPAQSIPIHLALKKLGGSMTPEPVDVMLWGVFRSTLLAVHDHLLMIDDTQAAKAATPEPAGGLPLDRAMMPQAGAFDAEGFKPRV
jgi:hypothetical protein